MSPEDLSTAIKTALMEGDEKCSYCLISLAAICLPNLNKKKSIIKARVVNSQDDSVVDPL